MVYMNHAAGSYPKPACVTEAVVTALSEPLCERGRCAGSGRDILTECREAVAKVLGVGNASRIYFTSGATESLNLLVRGLVKPDHAIAVTALEHNALLRPLYALFGEEHIHIMRPDPAGKISPEDILSAVGGKGGVVFVNHCSNVTGVLQDIETLAAAAHAAGALFVTDVSQSAGAMPLELEKAGVDAAVFTGHKALLGPTGTGGFYLRPGIEPEVSKWGGTGTGGRQVFAPDEPISYEVGTQNLCGLAGLRAGADFVRRTGLSEIARDVREKTKRVYDALCEMPGVKLYTGCPESSMIAFNVENLLPGDVGYILYRMYDINVRTGFHCAPLLADVLGAPQGTVRVSLSYLTSEDEINWLIAAMRQVTEGCGIENRED